MLHILQSKKLLVFDLDGTLLDSAKDLAIAINKTLTDLNIEPKTLAFVRNAIGHGAKVLLENCLPEPKDWTPEIHALFMKHYNACCSLNSELYPNALEILKNFSDKKLALLTNKPIEPTQTLLKKFNLDSYFQVVLGGDSLSTRKPNPEGLRYILQQTQTEIKDAILIGDGEPDILVAQNLDMDVLALTGGITSSEKILRLNPSFIIPHLSSLKLEN
jgi:phosphoglycolate phosphatase